jgi:hypothetical protein
MAVEALLVVGAYGEERREAESLEMAGHPEGAESLEMAGHPEGAENLEMAGHPEGAESLEMAVEALLVVGAYGEERREAESLEMAGHPGGAEFVRRSMQPNNISTCYTFYISVE